MHDCNSNDHATDHGRAGIAPALEDCCRSSASSSRYNPCMDPPRTETANQQHRKDSHTNKSTSTTSSGKGARRWNHSRKVPTEQQQKQTRSSTQPQRQRHDDDNEKHVDDCSNVKSSANGHKQNDCDAEVSVRGGSSKMKSNSHANHAKQKKKRGGKQHQLPKIDDEGKEKGISHSTIPNDSTELSSQNDVLKGIEDGKNARPKNHKKKKKSLGTNKNDINSDSQELESNKQAQLEGDKKENTKTKKKKKPQLRKPRKNVDKNVLPTDLSDPGASDGITALEEPADSVQLEIRVDNKDKNEEATNITSEDEPSLITSQTLMSKTSDKKSKHFIDLDALSKGNSKSKEDKKKKKKKKTKQTKKVDENLLDNLTTSLLDVDSINDLTTLLNSNLELLPLPNTTVDQILQHWMAQANFVSCTKLLRENQMHNGHRLSIWQTESLLQCLPQNIRGGSPYELLELIDMLAVSTRFGFNKGKHNNSEVYLISEENVRNYWCRIVRGICLEFVEEALTCRDRLCSSTALALRQTNSCLYPLTLKPSSQNQSNTYIYSAILPNNVNQGTVIGDLGGRGWVPGDAVGVLPCTTTSYENISKVTPSILNEFLIEGSILSYTSNSMTKTSKITLRLNTPLPKEYISNVSYRIDKLANRMSYNRLLYSICALCCSTRNNNPTLLHILTSKPRVPELLGLCTDIIGLDLKDPEDIYADAGGSVAHGAGRLNVSQQQAVITALRQRLTLIQGPPGTGKTQVAIRILHCLCRMRSQNQQGKVLAVSDSNIAVDNLVAGCAELGLRVLRLGRPESVRQDLLRYCLPVGGSNNGDQGNRKQLLQSADIICTTCIGSGTATLQSLNLNFNYVLIDEASQCTEAAVLVPIQLASRQSQQCQVALIGDHCQLPPTVLSRLACEAPTCLHIPLFTRLTDSHPTLQDGVICLLDTQYRMHPGIAQFVSDVFYCGRLKDGVTGSQRRALKGFPWPRMEFPVAFVPIYAMENESSSEHSRYNEAEAEAAVHAVEALLAGGQCTEADVAIVTPYAAQVRLIRRMLSMRANHYTHADNFNQIEVSSTDGFQGREKEAIIFSTVRSNQSQTTGFTSDWRRMNVSFTRARRALIVIGNDYTLRHGVQADNSNSNSATGTNSANVSMWSLWLSWVDAHGLNMDRPGLVRGRYDAELMRKIRAVATRSIENSPDDIDVSGKQNDLVLDSSSTRCREQEQRKDEEDLQLIRQDLAEFTNSEGHWDDSDDDSKSCSSNNSSVSSSGKTMKMLTSSRNTSLTNSSIEGEDMVIDAWDL